MGVRQVDVPAIGYTFPGQSMVSVTIACFHYKEMMQEGYTEVSPGCYIGLISSVSIQTAYSSFPRLLAGMLLVVARLSKKHFEYPRTSSHLDKYQMRYAPPISPYHAFLTADPDSEELPLLESE